MKMLLKIEEAGFFLFSIWMFSLSGWAWWWFPVLLLAPDISMAGYLISPKVGAIIYNIIHHRALALAIFTAGVLLVLPILEAAGAVLLAHSSLDRVFAYGLKYTDRFKHSHLNPEEG